MLKQLFVVALMFCGASSSDSLADEPKTTTPVSIAMSNGFRFYLRSQGATVDFVYSARKWSDGRTLFEVHRGNWKVFALCSVKYFFQEPLDRFEIAGCEWRDEQWQVYDYNSRYFLMPILGLSQNEPSDWMWRGFVRETVRENPGSTKSVSLSVPKFLEHRLFSANLRATLRNRLAFSFSQLSPGDRDEIHLQIDQTVAAISKKHSSGNPDMSQFDIPGIDWIFEKYLTQDAGGQSLTFRDSRFSEYSEPPISIHQITNAIVRFESLILSFSDLSDWTHSDLRQFQVNVGVGPRIFPSIAYKTPLNRIKDQLISEFINHNIGDRSSLDFVFNSLENEITRNTRPLDFDPMIDPLFPESKVLLSAMTATDPDEVTWRYLIDYNLENSIREWIAAREVIRLQKK